MLSRPEAIRRIMDQALAFRTLRAIDRGCLSKRTLTGNRDFRHEGSRPHFLNSLTRSTEVISHAGDVETLLSQSPVCAFFSLLPRLNGLTGGKFNSV
jgi:hypothetical protein